MSSKQSAISTSIRQEAEQRFLGQRRVVGISETQSGERQIVFLLSERSQRLEKSIRTWATNRNVSAAVKVVGHFALLKTG
jgi:hypothetical protein